jgi:hypothetical protein
MDKRTWRDQVKQIGDSIPEKSKNFRNHVRDSAPQVSQRVRQQIEGATPVIRYRAQEVTKALRSPMPPQPPTPADWQTAQQPAQQPFMGMPTQGVVGPGWNAAPAPVASPRRPTAVQLACLCLLTAAVASTILAALGVSGLIELKGSVEKVIHLDPTGTVAFYTNPYVNYTETTLTFLTVGFGIAFAVAYVFVAFTVWKGHGWPRRIGTVLVILSLPVLLLGPVAIAAVLAGIIAVIAIWLPSARQYAVGSKAAKRARRVSARPTFPQPR